MRHLLWVLVLALALSAQSGYQVKAITFTASSGDIEILPVIQTTQTYKIHKIVFSLAATTDVTYDQGTGTACATGIAGLSGTMKTVQSIIDTFPIPLELGPGKAFCIKLSGASTGGGYVIWSN